MCAISTQLKTMILTDKAAKMPFALTVTIISIVSVQRVIILLSSDKKHKKTHAASFVAPLLH